MKKFEPFIYGSATFLCFMCVWYIRWTAMPDTGGVADYPFPMDETEDSKDYVFVLLNMGFIMLVVGLSSVLHRHDDYFKFEKLEAYYGTIEGEYNTQIETIKAQVKGEENKVEADFMQRANTHKTDYRDNEGKDIRQSEGIVLDLLTHLLSIKKNLSKVFPDAIVDLRTEIIFSRQREGLTAVDYSNTPIKALDFYEDVDFSAVTKTERKPSSTSGVNVKLASKNGRIPHDFSTHLSVILLVIASFLLPSCSTDNADKPIGRTLGFIGDWSMSVQDSTALPPPESLFTFGLKKVGFMPTRATHDKVSFLTTRTVNTSFAPVYGCELPQGYEVKSKRQKFQKAVAACIYDKIKVQSQQKNLSQSYFGASLSQILRPMAHSTDSVRVLLIASDMILNNKNVANFYSYGDTLMDNYDAIVQKIEDEYPDLKNIDLTGLQTFATYLPSKQTDIAAKSARIFWGRWFASKGGTIEFLPNLPSHKAIAHQ